LSPIALCQNQPPTNADSRLPVGDGKIHCSVQAAAASSEALSAIAAGNLERAETLYAAQVASSPSAAAYVGLVHAQLAGDKLSAALATVKSALAAMPKSAEIQAVTADFLLWSGQIPEAATGYSRALALDNCSPRGHLGMGLVNRLFARHAAADHEFDIAHKLAPYDTEIVAEYLTSLPEAERAVPLKAFLAGKPQLPPDQIEELTRRLAILEGHKLCTEVDSSLTVKLPLVPVMVNGTLIRSWGFTTQLNHDS
jgi:tetratricopeptide (TPR) repeat protein